MKIEMRANKSFNAEASKLPAHTTQQQYPYKSKSNNLACCRLQEHAMSYTVSYIANSYYGLAVWRAVAFNDHSTRVREMGKKRQLLARSRLEKDVFSSYVALQSARSLPPAPNSLSLRGWFFDDVDPPRRLKGDYYTCS